MENTKWLMPTYYKDFKCKCGACRHSCCHGWQIDLSRDEYLKIISQECDEDLRHRFDIGFKAPDFVDENVYRIISFNYLGDCPIQKNGLCEIHKNFGEGTLPKICRLFPRSLKRINDFNTACCSSSCEAVVELLMNDEPLKLISDYLNETPSLEYTVDEKIKFELNHFEEIMEDQSISIDKRIETICLEINKDEFISDYNKDLNPIKEGLYLLKRLSSDDYLSDIYKEINNRYENNCFQYELDKEVFIKRFPNWQLYFVNVLANSLLYENFPFVDKRFNKTLAYKGLCASYGLLMIVAVGYTSTHNKKDDLIDCVAALFHLIDHTAFYYNINILAKAPSLFLKL